MIASSGPRDLLISPLADQLDAVYRAVALMMAAQGVARAADLVASQARFRRDLAPNPSRGMIMSEWWSPTGFRLWR